MVKKKMTQTCDRCGKTLQRDTGPNMPIKNQMTGETYCGDCMMQMLESMSTPVNDNFEVKEFSKKAADELALLAGVKSSSISMMSKQFLSFDVEIKVNNNVYEVVYIYDLIRNRSRWIAARDYLVSWIKQHQLSRKTWNTKTSANPNLVQDGRFVLIFLPEVYPEPPSSIGAQVAKELCSAVDPAKLGWMICPVAIDSEEHNKRDIVQAISTWANTQSRPETLRFNSKTIKVKSAPEKWTCFVVQRV
jgi:hypothetical protein